MVTVQIEPTELEDIKLMAQKRHNAKDKSFRNTGILIPDPASVYAPHTIGLVGEFAWGKHTNRSRRTRTKDKTTGVCQQNSRPLCTNTGE